MYRGLLATLIGMALALVANTTRAQTPVDAHWIWYDEGDPTVSAPKGSVWFRAELRATEPSTGLIRVACDDQFVLWVNGQRVGEGDELKNYRFNLNGIVERGPNVIAIEAKNSGGKAGLLVDGEIRGQGGKSLPFDSSATWLATRDAPAGDAWKKPLFDSSAWTPARDLGPHDGSPWMAIDFSETYLDRYQVPLNFEIRRIAEPELVGSVVAISWGNRGRLFASPEGLPVLSLRDENNDGVYDAKTEYCSLVTNCQGLCQVGDDLHVVGNGPDGAGIYRLPDADHDDVADAVQLVATTKGGMGEHGPHDVVYGPDGWLYHNLGNHANIKETPQATTPVRDPYEGDLLQPRFEDGNGHAVGIKVPGGSIWRFSPDGKQWWLETAGFRNQYDVAFNERGDLFTFDSDMEWDVGQPWYRPVRVNHCIPGSEFGWRSGTANWPEYFFDSLPSTADVGRGSPTGVVFYEHQQLPEKYHGSLLVCDWSMGRIIAVFLEPHGVSYRGTWETLVSGNPLNVSDIEVDRDGSVVFSTGGRRTEGGIYRVVYQKSRASRAATASTLDELLSLPQSQSAWARELATRLRSSLGDKWEAGLLKAAREDSPARQVRALVLLSQIGPRPSAKLLQELAAAGPPQVRALCAWLLGDHPSPETRTVLAGLLTDGDPLVARRACEGFVRSGLEAPWKSLLSLLASDDRWLAFAARLALERVPPEKWRKAVDHGPNNVQLQGLLACQHLGESALAANEALQRELKLLKSSNLSFPSRDGLDLLRMIQLSLLSGANGDEVAQIGKILLQKFPLATETSEQQAFVVATNEELARLLAYLQVPEANVKLMHALRQAASQEEQLHYALALRYLNEGWTPDSLQGLLAWYETTLPWEGGHSLRANVDNIVSASLTRMGALDRKNFLADWARHPAAARLILRQSQPEQVADFDQVVAGIFQDVDRDPDLLAIGQEVIGTAIDALGKSSSPQAQLHLRKLYDEIPDRRDQLARVLAQNPSLESWPQLVQSLQFGDAVTVQLCLGALQRLDRKPEKSEEYRSVILAGLKLADQGGLAAAELLERWTGSRHGAGLDAKAALVHYQDWFKEAYPDAVPAELPADNAEKTRYTYQQLFDLLEKDPAGRGGDAQRGELAFGKANCIKCHRFLTKGEGVGPELTAVRRRFQRKEIIESLVYPSLVVSDQYRSVTISTVDGQVFTGMPLVQQDPNKVVLLLPDATKLEIAKEKIDESSPSKSSVMPEGVLKELSPAEIIDLFAFLETSKDNPIPAGSVPDKNASAPKDDKN